MKPDPLIDRSQEQKQIRADKIRAELTNIDALRQSVPTAELARYYDCGWAYVMPDFDKPGHSFVDWLSSKRPVYPSRSQKPSTENVSDGSHDRP